jgi:hypothetical protein
VLYRAYLLDRQPRRHRAATGYTHSRLPAVAGLDRHAVPQYEAMRPTDALVSRWTKAAEQEEKRKKE